ncbi:MAG TPA: hypothetical protein VFY87_20535 [Geminicoccaceae bacterium]|nr:hypothetical protein [Geminicoccaceae bacterium]
MDQHLAAYRALLADSRPTVPRFFADPARRGAEGASRRAGDPELANV